jgi:hypothetical protein
VSLPEGMSMLVSLPRLVVVRMSQVTKRETIGETDGIQAASPYPGRHSRTSKIFACRSCGTGLTDN